MNILDWFRGREEEEGELATVPMQCPDSGTTWYAPPSGVQIAEQEGWKRVEEEKQDAQHTQERKKGR
jgi:hypothetical protein